MLRVWRIVASWFGGFHPPQGAVPEPDRRSGTQPLVSHIHQWGACKWNGQYWYARCTVTETCTARVAC